VSREMKYMNILEKMASTHEIDSSHSSKIASCLVYKNDILAFGLNKTKSHPFQVKYCRHVKSIYLHSETDCIKNALRVATEEEIAKSTLYICRIKYADRTKSKMVWGLSRPCSGCMKAIITFNIKKVVYSCDNNTFEYL
jgi:tRNA(Arg) A34 adenosine deaminase TadA